MRLPQWWVWRVSFMGRRSLVPAGIAAVIAAGAVLTVAHADPPPPPDSNTPIKHLVVIFDENESFDHYFGTYPKAANTNPGEPVFNGVVGNKAVNGLTDALLNHNPNLANPQRLPRSSAVPCGQNHTYGAEQAAFDSPPNVDGARMDQFVQFTSGGSCLPRGTPIVMDYYDGNTVTALWNLAQHFALNDNSFGTTFGPSTPGAINLVSGNTHGVNPGNDADGTLTMTGDPNPVDDCFGGTAVMTGQNIGDLMNAQNMTWGWFQGGFKPTATAGGIATCASTHLNAAGGVVVDYSPHHEPFQYYASTANPHHLRPTGPIGTTDQANHQYDLSDFDDALAAGALPQVSFLKPAAFEDAHPGNSGPIDEQRFIARTLNALEGSPVWDSTAVIIAYDDSDGWYDHVAPPVLQPSRAASDALNGAGKCGATAPGGGDYQDRCGPGPRLPLLVISPWAKQNYVDSTFTEQTSILKLIEDNWTLPRIGDSSFDVRAGPLTGMFDFDPAHPRAPKLLLDPKWGVPQGAPTPTPVPTARPTPQPTPTPQPIIVRKPSVKLSCRTTGSGKKLTISCTASGADATKPTTLRFRLVRGSKVVASVTTKLSHKRAKIVIKPKKRLRAGRYSLRVTITQSGGVLAQTLSVRVK